MVFTSFQYAMELGKDWSLMQRSPSAEPKMLNNHGNELKPTALHVFY